MRSRTEVGRLERPEVKLSTVFAVLLALTLAGSSIPQLSLGDGVGKIQAVEAAPATAIGDQQTVSIGAASGSGGQAITPYGGDYSLIGGGGGGDGDGNGNSLLNLGQPVLNNKRARKISAFMPMRGRKDGRDQRQPEQQQPQQLQQWALLAEEPAEAEALLAGAPMGPLRESELGDATILRLVANEPPNVGHWFGATPRQFANQLAARHLLVGSQQSRADQQQQQHPQQQQQLVHLNREFGDESASFDASNQFELGDPASAQIMQAKLRRAFHPMRGKKADGRLLANELAAFTSALEGSMRRQYA